LGIGKDGTFSQDGQEAYNVELELLQILEAHHPEPLAKCAIAIPATAAERG
jgi:hypothetical protein